MQKGQKSRAVPGDLESLQFPRHMGADDPVREFVGRTPMGRLGDGDEVARIAVFLATEDSSYITGQIIYCDGGRLALNYVVPVEE